MLGRLWGARARLLLDHRLRAVVSLGGVCASASSTSYSHARHASSSESSSAPPPPPRPIEGALFDLDGTLVDSEHLSPLAWGAVLAEVGAVPREAVAGGKDTLGLGAVISAPEMRGASAVTIAEHLITTYAIEPRHDAAWLVARKRALAVEVRVSTDCFGLVQNERDS